MSPAGHDSNAHEVLDQVGKELRAPRAAGVAGLLFAILFIGVLALVRAPAAAPGEALAQWYASGLARTRIVLMGLYAIPVAGIAFLWFIGAVRARIGSREDQLFATVFLGSGLLFVAMLFAAAATASAMALRLDMMATEGPVEPGVMQFSQALTYTFLYVYAARAAGVFMIVTSTIAIRAKAVPRWIGFVGYAIALLLLLSIRQFQIIMTLFPLWVALLSIFILVSPPIGAPAAQAASEPGAERVTAGPTPYPPEKPDRGKLRADLIVGVTNGVANIPDAMANALLAGVSPIVGLYALLAGTPAAALTTSSQFMTVAVTAAMAVTVGSGLAAVPSAQRDAAIATMAVLVGVFMALFGILRGGRLLRFVSNAVMKGFLNGVAVVIVGQLSNITGFSATSPTKIGKAVSTFLNVRDWDPVTLAVGLLTVALIVALMRTRLRDFAMLIALVIATAGVYFLPIDIPLVKSVSEIPSGLPMPGLPSLALVPGLVIPALSVALIGLVQGGGISKAFPNADGTYPNPSRDMIGQGIGNVAAGAFGGMPIGASVSSTALAVAGGARTRWSNVIIGVVVAVVLVLLGPAVELVPLTVLAGILIVVGVSAIDIDGMRDVWNASKESAVIMAVTLGSMLVMPVQFAVLLGAALSAVQYVYSSSKDVRVVALHRLPDGQWSEQAPPEVLPSSAVTVVDIYGSVFYAGVELVDRLLPSVGDARRPVLVVRLRSHSEVGSTFILMIRRYHEQILAADGRLILAGVRERLMAQLISTGVLDEIGAENVLPMSDVVFQSTAAAIELGEAALRDAPPDEEDPTG